jgi:Flp pilus assembly protein TadG
MTARIPTIMKPFRLDWRRDASGASAVEFALVSPIFLLILVASVDFGISIYDRFNLNASISAATNYALLNAANVESTDGSALALTLGYIIASEKSMNWANATVVVNNGPSVSVTSGIVTASGSASAANSCYCPTSGTTGIIWGGAMTCGATCTGGGVAGKFVYMSATMQYTSIFGTRAIVSSGPLTASSIAETE